MKAKFVIGIHFHQPTGNFDDVIAGACDKCYVPFIDTLKKYPKIKMSFHFTGCLLEWMDNNRPEIIEDIKEMVASGQIEMIAGGFYEPILPSIPQKDRIGQIEMLKKYIKTKFSYQAKGAWIAERVWEPALASDLNEAGIKYIILDDTHFMYSGVRKETTYGYYVTEDNGKTVAVFPSDKTLRYYIPFKMPEESMNYMRGIFESGKGDTFIYGDDGEKFGEWPGTHKWVFEEKWLEKFFNEIMKNTDWLETVKFSDCLEKNPPLGRVYLPTSSYEEMLEWALPWDMQMQYEDAHKDIEHLGKKDFYGPFIRGSFWRTFFSKYPESNQMNKKMIYVSNKLTDAITKFGASSSLEEATKELYMGQCNCAYWHGVFGGLYLFHLRRAVYHHLIKSETLIDNVIYGKKDFCEGKVVDYDADGMDEVILENKELALYIDPFEGGVLKELDSKKVCQNLINSLSRKREAYHRKIEEKLRSGQGDESGECKTIHDGIQKVEKGVGENLVYDWYGRSSLIDHFIDKGTNINDFSKCAYRELGDFVNNSYSHDLKKSDSGITLTLKREGLVKGVRVDLTKEIYLPKKGSKITIKYRLENKGTKNLKIMFAPEFNLTMPDADSEKYEIFVDGKNLKKRVSDIFEIEKVGDIEVKDSTYLSWKMAISRKILLWVFPVKTVSQSERAYELNYQSSAVLPLLELDMAPKRTEEIKIDITITT